MNIVATILGSRVNITKTTAYAKGASKMNANRNVARIVGILFVIGTVAGLLSVYLMGDISSESYLLTKVSENGNQMIIGTLFVLVMGLSLAMVPIVMFPIFRKYNEALALGSVIFRGALEAILYIAIAIIYLLLLVVSQESLKLGASDVAYLQNLGAILLKAVDQVNSILKIVFSIGALMIYYLYYQSKLIPQWLSFWGLIGAIFYFIAGLFTLFGMDFSILLIPLGLQEMILAVWLIVKGFNSPAIVSVSASAV